MLILGIDPGLVNTGWAVIEFDKTKKSKIVNCGLVRTKGSQNITLRLARILDDLNKSLGQYKFDCAALEKTLVNKNAVSSMDLSMGRAIALLYFGQNNIQYKEYFPTFIKKAITGNGNAEKSSIRAMLQHYFEADNIEEIEKLSHHEVDALAIALCHGFACDNSMLD
jgi:crossover junction endodeoxyribonuclease RuvC